MTVKDKVKQLLLDNPTNRDSDTKLVANYWYFELTKKGVDLNEISAFDFLNYYSKTKLTLAKTIVRTRADLQKEFTELRGKNYKLRQTTLKNKVRKELGYEAY
jgi:hypothetical protein